MKIWYSLYELKPVKMSKGVKCSNKGVLLKFEDESYSLYHPVESLGDRPLNDFLENLLEKNVLLDNVKKASVSKKLLGLYKEKKIKCYYSSPTFEHLFEHVESLISKNFKTVKIKVSFVGEIEKKMNQLKKLPFKYIFDFNGRGSEEDFINLKEESILFFKNQVLYVEDPCRKAFSLSYVRIASDFENYGEKWDLRVIKPTAFNHKIPRVLPEHSIVTSYLDHPLGQIISALWAVDHKIKHECGLFSHVYYEDNKYSLLFKGEEACLNLAVGSSFLNLLEKESWVLASNFKKTRF